MSSARAVFLVEELREAAEALIAVVDAIDPADWVRVPEPSVWSPGKDVEHVVEAAGYHQWIVRVSLGQKRLVRPALERKLLISRLPRAASVELLRQRTEESASLVLGLSDKQLDLPVRPLQARPRPLAEMIQGRMIGHYRGHLLDIEAKLRKIGPR